MTRVLLLLILFGSALAPASFAAETAAFSYQGRLFDRGQPASGKYDLRFNLCDSIVNGNYLSSSTTNFGVLVSNGVFMATVDFGAGVFDGSARWLEIAVRSNGTATAFSPLSPRQSILYAPYSVFATSAANAGVATNLAPGVLITANGAGLTNLDGLQFRPGTVNSNALDAATASQLALAGAIQNRAFISIEPSGRYTANGVTYTPTNSLTAGIQEAINALPLAVDNSRCGGGTIVFAPGTYYTYAAITSPNTTNAFSLTLVGPGMTAGGITYIGETPQTVLKFGKQGWNNQILVARNMWIASDKNAPTNIVWLNGASSFGGPSGGIATADIDYCWFGYWHSMTNNAAGTRPGTGIFNPSCINDGQKHNLIGLDAQGNGANLVKISNCQFTYCAVGLSLSADHAAIHNNTFSFCGIDLAGPSPLNDWPWSSPYRIGGGICVCETGGFGSVYNGQKNWTFFGNMFINSSPAYVVETGFKSPRVSYSDAFEDELGSAMIATADVPWTFVNPINYTAANNRYRITNTIDHSTWRLQRAAADLVSVWDMAANSYDGPFAFVGRIGGNGGSLTNLGPGALRATNVPAAGNYLRVDSTGTNLYFSPN